MVGEDPAPARLAVDGLLGQFASRRSLAIRRYRDFVTAGIGQESIWKALNRQAFLGDDRFVSRMQERMKGEDRKNLNIPKSQRRLPPPPLDELAKKYAESVGRKSTPRRPSNRPRAPRLPDRRWRPPCRIGSPWPSSMRRAGPAISVRLVGARRPDASQTPPRIARSELPQLAYLLTGFGIPEAAVLSRKGGASKRDLTPRSSEAQDA